MAAPSGQRSRRGRAAASPRCPGGDPAVIPSTRAVARHLDLPLPWREPLAGPLDQAYRHCAEVARRHSKSFYFSGWLLPPEKRRAMFGLYAFCRRCDDAVDLGADAETCLHDWRRAIYLARADGDDPVLLVWL